MSRLARNILYNLVGQSATLLLTLVAVRVVYRQLGDAAVGIVFFAITLNSVLQSVMDLGISSTIVREVAAAARRPPGHIVRVMRTAASFYWTAYIVLGTASVALGGVMAERWLNLGELDHQAAASSLRVLCGGLLLALPRSLYVNLFRGLERIGTTTAIDAGIAIVQQAGIAATVFLGGSLLAVSWSISATSALGVVVYAVAALQVVPARALLPGFDRDVAAGNRDYASRMTIISALTVVHAHTDKLIVSRMLPLGAFGLYGVVYNALSRGMIATAALAQVAFPILAGLHSSGDRVRLLNQYRRLHFLVVYAMVAVFAAAPFAALPGIEWLFGPEQAHQMLVPCTLLALGFYMNSTVTMPYMLSLAVGNAGITLALNAWAVAIVLPTTMALTWVWGLNGAAFSWVCYHLFAYAYMIPRVCRECADGDIRGWYLGVLRFFVPAVCIYGTAWFGAAAAGSSAWMFVGAYGIATLSYLAVGWTRLPADALVGLWQGSAGVTAARAPV